MSKSLVTTDLHLTDNDLDKYRWDVFNVLKDLINQYKVNCLTILGDLTEKKNYHSAELVNDIIFNLYYLTDIQNLERINILCGNHDYKDKENPFFGFLQIKHGNCIIDFINKPKLINNDLYIPHSYTNFKEIAKQYKSCNNLFLHHSFNGVKMSDNTYEKDSNNIIDLSEFVYNKCYSGHIHLAQEFKGINFIGSPYPVKFGDNNRGRVLLIDNLYHKYLSLPRFVQKLDISLSDVNEILNYDIYENDQIKIELRITKDNIDKCEERVAFLRNYINEKKALLVSLQTILEHEITHEKIENSKTVQMTDKEVLLQFWRRKNLPNTYLFTGYSLINYNDD